MRIRNATASDITSLARVWFDGWRDAHAAIVPAGLVRARTLDSLEARMRDMLPDVRVLVRADLVGGFYRLKGDELDQFFLAADLRGTGAAAVLMADAEQRLSAGGFAAARLDCAAGNLRAARFYEKCGWQRQATLDSRIETGEGVFTIPIWRYVKTLDSAASQRER